MIDKTNNETPFVEKSKQSHKFLDELSIQKKIILNRLKDVLRAKKIFQNKKKLLRSC